MFYTTLLFLLWVCEAAWLSDAILPNKFFLHDLAYIGGYVIFFCIFPVVHLSVLSYFSDY